jgi:hypothetical protein
MEEERTDAAQPSINTQKGTLDFESGYVREHSVNIQDITYIVALGYFMIVRTSTEIFITHKRQDILLAKGLLEMKDSFVQINSSCIVDRCVITEWTDKHVIIEIGNHKKTIDREPRFKRHFVEKLMTAE